MWEKDLHLSFKDKEKFEPKAISLLFISRIYITTHLLCFMIKDNTATLVSANEENMHKSNSIINCVFMFLTEIDYYTFKTKYQIKETLIFLQERAHK